MKLPMAALSIFRDEIESGPRNRNDQIDFFEATVLMLRQLDETNNTAELAQSASRGPDAESPTDRAILRQMAKELCDRSKPLTTEDITELDRKLRALFSCSPDPKVRKDAFKLWEALHETWIQGLRSQGKTELADEWERLTSDLKAKTKMFEFIGGGGDLTALLKDTTLMNGSTRLDALISMLGPTKVGELARMLLGSKIREAATTLKDGKPVIGGVRAKEVLAWYKELRAIPGTNKFFEVDAETSAYYAKVMADSESVAFVTRITKGGIVAAILALLVLAFVALLLILKRHG